ncbi:MAG: ATP-binding protein [Acholeplasmatales bacterium]
MFIKRKIYDDLLNWKKEQGKTALVIEGARRVGKTTVVKEFAKNEYRSFIFIDFSIASDEVKSLFTKYASNLDEFFFLLSTITGTTLYERESLIIFDEIQLFPKARQLIKHLVFDNRYDYIETGSLLGLKRNVENILIPSEERMLKMYPLDFEEFCLALGKEDLFNVIKKHFEELKPLTVLHSSIMKLFRMYLLVGGMPQAVLEYLKTNDYNKVDRVKRDILTLYRNDISKYAKGYEYKVLSIFDEIPSQLSKHEKKFSLNSIEKEARFRDYEKAFMWLNEAMITNPCYNANDPSVGLSLYKDRLTLKMYMADTGLLLSHAFDEDSKMQTEIAKKIIADKLEVNNGMIFENIVAQMLATNGKNLYFYSRYDNSNSKNTMEIDFLIKDLQKPTKISPVEVKSGKNYTVSSMNKFTNKFKNKLGRKYLLHAKDLVVKDDIIYLPVYMTIFL